MKVEPLPGSLCTLISPPGYLRYAFDYAQPYAVAGHRAGRVALPELVKNVLLRILVHSRAAVAHADGNAAAGGRKRRSLHCRRRE